MKWTTPIIVSMSVLFHGDVSDIDQTGRCRQPGRRVALDMSSHTDGAARSMAVPSRHRRRHFQYSGRAGRATFNSQPKPRPPCEVF